jgi:DNA polymerase III sliding clamp (beta) subunit (PCNA family)
MSTPEEMFTISQSDLAELMTKTVMKASNQAIALYLNGYANLLANASLSSTSGQSVAIAKSVLTQISQQMKEHAESLRQQSS